MEYIHRHIADFVTETSKGFKVILLTGARQIGKSTLLKNQFRNYHYYSFDNIAGIKQAIDDPNEFLDIHQPPIILDEIQYAPELFLNIKAVVDNHDKAGQFLLSGSQKFVLMKRINESLAGRVAIIDMYGLSLREIVNSSLRVPFTPSKEYLLNYSPNTITDIWDIIWRGSMPSLYSTKIKPATFFASYIRTYITKDVIPILDVADIGQFIQFVTMLASRIGSPLNLSSLAMDMSISTPTAKRWLSVLEATNQIYLLKPYFNNLTKRITKAPKIYFCDTGLATYLLRYQTPEMLRVGAMNGPIFENFAIMEIVKSFVNSGVIDPPLYFYRDRDRYEVDLLIQNGDYFDAIEFKAGMTIQDKNAKNFNAFERVSGYSIKNKAIISNSKEYYKLGMDVRVIPVWYI
jgi:predicted AAA+ superfamily ATPase